MSFHLGPQLVVHEVLDEGVGEAEDEDGAALLRLDAAAGTVELVATAVVGTIGGRSHLDWKALTCSDSEVDLSGNSYWAL